MNKTIETNLKLENQKNQANELTHILIKLALATIVFILISL